MNAKVLGIDLGTTNSVVALANGSESRVLADSDGRRLVPSVVSFHPDGTILVGHEARERRLVDAANTVYSTKRLIGRPFTSVEVQRAKERFAFQLEPTRAGGVQVRVRKGAFALPEISAMVLRHLRSVAEESLGEVVSSAVITVPANFNELQRSATQAAGKVAGLEVLRILNEPTAATLAYGLSTQRAERVAVYDLGGGTFDLTVLDLHRDAYEVISTAGDTFLGGDDIDLLIAERMAVKCLEEHRFDAKADPQSFERLRAAAEWAKCQLSSVTIVDVTLEEFFVGSSGAPVDFAFQFTREELDAMIRPLLARSFDLVNDALRTAGRRPKELDSVVLVGGSTRIPLLRQMVAEFFQREPRTDLDPDLVVAQGAAILGHTLASASVLKPPAKDHRTALGRVPLRKARRPEVLPRQPAFAPDEQRDEAPARHIQREDRASQRPRRQTADVHAPTTPPDRTQRPKGSSKPPPPPPAGRRTSTQPGLTPPPSGLFEEPTSDGFVLESTAARRPVVGTLDDLDEPGAAPPPRAIARPLLAVGTSDSDPTLKARFDGVAAAPAGPTARPLDDSRPVLREHTGEFVLPVQGRGEPRRPPSIPPVLDLPSDPFPEPTPATITAPMPAVGAAGADAILSKRGRTMLGTARGADSGALPIPAPPQGSPAQAARHVPPPEPRGAPPPPPARAQTSPLPEAKPLPLAAPALHAPMPAIAATPAKPAAISTARAAPPLLMDVTPLSLGVEMAGGFSQPIVARNAPIPTEKSRVFATGRDGQTQVELRICQGESVRFSENQLLGTLDVGPVRSAKRGDVRVEITFILDANGILEVKAVDLDSQRVQQTRIALQGGIEPAELEAMQARQRELLT